MIHFSFLFLSVLLLDLWCRAEAKCSLIKYHLYSRPVGRKLDALGRRAQCFEQSEKRSLSCRWWQCFLTHLMSGVKRSWVCSWVKLENATRVIEPVLLGDWSDLTLKRKNTHSERGNMFKSNERGNFNCIQTTVTYIGDYMGALYMLYGLTDKYIHRINRQTLSRPWKYNIACMVCIYHFNLTMNWYIYIF